VHSEQVTDVDSKWLEILSKSAPWVLSGIILGFAIFWLLSPLIPRLAEPLGIPNLAVIPLVLVPCLSVGLLTARWVDERWKKLQASREHQRAAAQAATQAQARYRDLSSPQIEVLRLFAERKADTLTLGAIIGRLEREFPAVAGREVVASLASKGLLRRESWDGAWEQTPVVLWFQTYLDLAHDPSLVGVDPPRQQ
jgi:hypothetical protein